MLWNIYQFAITMFVALFVPETDPVLESELAKLNLPKEEEHGMSLKQSVSIFIDLLSNKQVMLIWTGMRFLATVGISIQLNITQVYLTNDLGFPKETLSMIKVIAFPVSVLATVLLGYFPANNLFKRIHFFMFLYLGVSTYSVLGMMYFFPAQDQITWWTTAHVVVVMFTTELVRDLYMTTSFCIVQ